MLPAVLSIGRAIYDPPQRHIWFLVWTEVRASKPSIVNTLTIDCRTMHTRMYSFSTWHCWMTTMKTCPL